MNLKQYKEIMHKCSKCGLCQESCPIFRSKGNECVTARGVLILLRGVVNKEIKLTKNSMKLLDECLKCGLCTEICPSEINIEDIILVAKQKYLNTTLGGFVIKLFQSRLFEKKKKIKSQKHGKKCVYLGRNSVMVTKILNDNNIELLNKKELSWGVDYLLSGNLKRFKENFRRLIKELVELKPEFVVTDIPEKDFKQIISKYLGHKFNIKIIYLGEFNDAEKFVCKYYNSEYAKNVVRTSFGTKSTVNQ